MKTAMQELIDEITDSIAGIRTHGDKDSEFNKGSISNLTIIKVIAGRLLEKECVQICDAFVAGDERGTGEIPFNAEQYYHQKFISPSIKPTSNE